MTATETWLDAMPAIPLARAVPVHMRGRGVIVLTPFEAHGAQWVRVGRILGGKRDVPAKGCRVDLGDPQGFAYALRALVRDFAEVHPFDYDGPIDLVVIWRHLRGETTDADRLALAKACAEVAQRR